MILKVVAENEFKTIGALNNGRMKEKGENMWE
jgi:hypothetical protein